ncbi:sulfite oxidase heme-binding subunit YedZ [Beijerinckia indica]|uniref:Protein-methionine-sulfoxide reductase heme-binding subunit MsrQ n=1 Tax=Beijerinckia indica subsp. indica (strain ATCC 9039 / DSM 1715 / NCIMB 8712) TaxID=395963 RepID=B2IKV3_BEII9|nr:protein-methionine-sulfoxide reductase heme-binding subunit MsrQ [Beijerinckia indica]ACB96493.1 Ferric reductase domain protein transmembrane component domain [Beijerinckia indica subsp. indica ATCC 9039]
MITSSAFVPVPWMDRRGHFAPLKALVFAGVCMPALWLLASTFNDHLGSRPLTVALHESGLWSIRFLVLSLAITPLSQAMGSMRLSAVRRILGVSVFAYAALHFVLYLIDQQGDVGKIFNEITARPYLTLGFIALCGLALMAATSTDRIIAWLGTETWQNVQSLVYAIALLATLHFFMQAKIDVTEPIWMGGLFGLLGLIRFARKMFGDLSALALALLSLLAALLTAFGEAFWYHLSIGAPLGQILLANGDFSFSVRPAWYVLAGGLVLALIRLYRAPLPKRTRRS